MNRCAPDISYQEAQDIVRHDVQSCANLIGEPPRELGLKRPIDGVSRVVLDMIESAESLGRGEILSRILRLPLHWTNTLMEYVTQVHPYDGGRSSFDLEVELINTGPAPISAVLGVRELVRVDPNSGERSKTDRNIQKVWSTIEPGEIVTVDARFGVSLLRTHGWMSMRPGVWLAGDPQYSASDRPLREAGYTARYAELVDGARGKRVTTSSTEWQAKQAEERITRARELVAAKRSDEAAKLLDETPDWWPRPDGWDDATTRGRRAA